MATGTLWSQHRNNARDRAGDPEQNVNPYNGQKHRVSRRYFDSPEIGGSIAHAISSTALQLT
jgi:hypothetical protein